MIYYMNPSLVSENFASPVLQVCLPIQSHIQSGKARNSSGLRLWRVCSGRVGGSDLTSLAILVVPTGPSQRQTEQPISDATATWDSKTPLPSLFAPVKPNRATVCLFWLRWLARWGRETFARGEERLERYRCSKGTYEQVGKLAFQATVPA